jgi:peroxiredoxin
MKIRYRVLALLVILLIATTQTAFASEGDNTGKYALGDTLEDFSVPTTDGQTTSLYALLETHRAVLLNFWFVDCTWCNREFPGFEHLYETYGDDLAILALTPCDSLESVVDFQRENGLRFLLGTVEMSFAAEAFIPENSFPTTLLIDRNGICCYRQVDAFDSEKTVERLVLPYLADDYAGPVLTTEIPTAQPTDAMPPASDLGKVLGDANGAIAYSASDLPEAWPWLLGTVDGLDCAYSSNKGYNSTTACLRAMLSANEGDALVFDYRVSCEDCSDSLRVYVDGTRVKMFSGIHDWATYAYRFPSSGKMTVEFRYVKDFMSEAGEDAAYIANVRLMTGEEAGRAVDANAKYPVSLSGDDCLLTPLNPDIREIRIDFSSPVEYYADHPTAFYLTGDENIHFRVTLGPDCDPDGSSINYPQDEESISLTGLPTDAEGFLTTMPMTNDFDNDWNVAFVEAVSLVGSDDALDESKTRHAFVFSSEQSITEYCQDTLPKLTGGITATWSYQEASSSALPQPAQDQTAGADVTYTLKFADQNGEPVPGVIANICDESSCSPMVSDAQGIVTFTRAGYVYDIHIIKVPKGYAFDTAQGFKADVKGGEMSFTVPKQ